MQQCSGRSRSRQRETIQDEKQSWTGINSLTTTTTHALASSKEGVQWVESPELDLNNLMEVVATKLKLPKIFMKLMLDED